MSHKVPKPSLSGQRIKTRKRDEKEKYEPNSFREIIVTALNDCEDLEKAYKYLDAAGSKLDYHRYGENLFDILITGALIAPGGSLITDPNVGNCKISVFNYPKKDNDFKALAQLFNKLIRRYKYMEKALEENLKKVILFLKGFDDAQRKKLSKFIGILLSINVVNSKIIETLFQDHLVKDGLSLEFAKELFTSWIQDKKNVSALSLALKKNNLDDKLLNLLPINKRSALFLEEQFKQAGLDSLVTLHKAQVNDDAKKLFSAQLKRMLMRSENEEEEIDGESEQNQVLNENDDNDEDNVILQTDSKISTNKEIDLTISAQNSSPSSFDKMIKKLMELQKSSGFTDSEIIVLIWNTLMNLVEWNKKEDLISDQSLKHLKGHLKLIQAFVKSSHQTELTLLNRIQEYCYDNMNFMKVFQKIIITLYKSNILSEEVIVDWYNKSHCPKGKTIFREQIKPFVEWLHSAEEESSEDDEEDIDNRHHHHSKVLKGHLGDSPDCTLADNLIQESLTAPTEGIREISLENGAI